MKNLNNIPNKLSLDSSIILSYYLGEGLGEIVKELLFQDTDREFYMSLNSLTEIFYILCRRLGFNIANNKIDTLLKINAIQIISSTNLVSLAGKYKCERAISLSDCFVIGLAKYSGSIALFAKREKEINRELINNPFNVQILFLEDLEL
ncbi:MAG: PIN domain-containing protein [Candidatus Lokiarchaeota archaeon]|nr:PIN domain-containing protein [Candidatus Lokiarchaeota archaeon]